MDNIHKAPPLDYYITLTPQVKVDDTEKFVDDTVNQAIKIIGLDVSPIFDLVVGCIR